MKKAVSFIALLLVAYYVINNPQLIQQETGDSSAGQSVLAQVFQDRQSDVQVQGQGIVTRVLSDDNEGSRHQRFVLELADGQTILVAHNIDLAPRVDSIAVGDRIEFYGEYEWNDRGGVIHWTHHDPRGSHPDGWLRHKGRTYQ